MPQFTKNRTSGPKGVDLVVSSRVQTGLGALVIQGAGAAQVSAISYTVTEQVGPQQGVVTGSGTFTPSAVISDTLQTGGSWTQDNTGYNFQATIPGASFPDAGDYVILIQFTLTIGGTPFPVESYHHCYSLS